jgi:hypothetical protein
VDSGQEVVNKELSPLSEGADRRGWEGVRERRVGGREKEVGGRDAERGGCEGVRERRVRGGTEIVARYRAASLMPPPLESP